MATAATQLDSHVRVVTPENIGFEYRLASPYERGVAFLLDIIVGALILLAVVLISSMILGLLGVAFGAGSIIGLSGAVFLIAAFSIFWFYGGVFETLWNGQTPGKRAMSLRVVRTDGQPIDAMQAILRNFLRGLDSQPFGSHLVGLVSAACTSKYQRVGDLACGTIVVAEDRASARKAADLSDVNLQPMLDALPPNIYPSRSLSKVLMQYVDRRRVFGPPRRAEIARHVGQLLVERYDLPPETDHDLLLCALYYRAFVRETMDA